MRAASCLVADGRLRGGIVARGDSLQLNRRLQLGTPRSFTYDANGNTTSDGVRTFEWDARNQLVAVTVGTHRSEFTYDGQQRRVSLTETQEGSPQSETYFLWCRRILCQERNSSGAAPSRELTPLGDVSGAGIRLLAVDHIGSPWVVTDLSSSVVSRREFDPWGRVLATVSGASSVSFSGHLMNAPTEVIFTLYRGYLAEAGRWLSEDPLRWEEGPNLYTYANGNPVKWRDPLGLKVYRCCRDTEVGPILDAVASTFGAKHCFIKTDSREGGMGPAGGGGLPAFPLGIPTAIIDHTGQSSRSQCEEIPDADEECVNKRLAQGGSTGRWMPWNNCNTVAEGILCGCNSKRCDRDPYNTPMKPGGYK
jgi:RHS repeat-associated protein